MPYRAPELFDVKTGKTLDEKVDIWVSPKFAQDLTIVSRLYALRLRIWSITFRSRWSISPDGSGEWKI